MIIHIIDAPGVVQNYTLGEDLKRNLCPFLEYGSFILNLSCLKEDSW